MFLVKVELSLQLVYLNMVVEMLWPLQRTTLHLFSFLSFFKTINTIFFCSIQNQLRVLVATEDLYLYVYNIDSNESGELTLYKTHRLDNEKIDEKDDTDAVEQPTEPGKFDFVVVVCFVCLLVCFVINFLFCAKTTKCIENFE